MEYKVVNQSNKKVGTIALSDDIFSYPEKRHLFWEVVKWQRASKRQGTSSAKTRSEVVGSGRKLYAQKHTGRARAGDAQAPQRVGGGVAFGPRPRDYSYSVPKKVRKAALKSALSLKAKEDKLLILDALKLSEIKTKRFKEILDTLGIKKALFVIEGADEIVKKSARNIPDIKVLRAEGLNVFDVLKFDNLVITRAAAEKIEERLR